MFANTELLMFTIIDAATRIMNADFIIDNIILKRAWNRKTRKRSSRTSPRRCVKRRSHWSPTWSTTKRYSKLYADVPVGPILQNERRGRTSQAGWTTAAIGFQRHSKNLNQKPVIVSVLLSALFRIGLVSMAEPIIIILLNIEAQHQTW